MPLPRDRLDHKAPCISLRIVLITLCLVCLLFLRVCNTVLFTMVSAVLTWWWSLRKGPVMTCVNPVKALLGLCSKSVNKSADASRDADLYNIWKEAA